MKKYLVEESNYRHDLNRVGKNNNTYDSGSCEVFDTLEEANKAAIATWDHLTEEERKHSEVEVLVVAEDGLSIWAIDDETGEIDWTAYDNAYTPEGGLYFSGLNPYNVRGKYMTRSIKDVIKNIKLITLYSDVYENGCEDVLEDAESGYCCLSTNGDPDFYHDFNQLLEIEKDDIDSKSEAENFWNKLAQIERITPEKLEDYSDDELLQSVKHHYGKGEADFIADMAYEDYKYYMSL